MFGKLLRAAGNVLRRCKTLLVAGAAVSLGSYAAMAQAPDASAIVTTAESTFNTVGALIVSTVGFFIIVKIVKWIRK